MNSPIEPGSPSPSTPSSGTPPPEDTVPQFNPPSGQLSESFSRITAALTASPGGSKRRLPGGVSFNVRDAKSRRREDVMSSGGRRGGWSEGKEQASQGGARTNKEELVDIPLAEQLRKEFGDPFQEDLLKDMS